MNARELRWKDTEAELPEELRAWLRDGGAPLGGSDEVAELRQRLARALGPAAGLGGGEPPSGDVPTEGGAPDAGAAPAAGGVPSARTSASGPDPGSALAPPPGSNAPPAAPRLRLARGARAALGGAAVAIGVAMYVSSSSAPPAPPGGGVAAGEPAALPPLDVAPPADAPAAPALTPPPAAPPVAAEGRSTPAEPAARRVRPKLPLPPGLGEAALLERARNELRKSPARALAITREHQSRFPRGVMAEEREVIAIEALKRLGRSAAAAARTAEFERRYRGSVHRQRLEGNERTPR